MKLAIEISDEVYKYCKQYCRPNDEKKFVSDMIDRIAHGTPLPKGHGRLGDLDALETEMVNGIRAGNYEEGYEDYPHINDMDDCVECVKCADTLIEADKGDD